MSIPVDLDQLAAAMADYPTAFLITVNADLPVHAVQVHPRLEDGALRVAAPGRRTAANLAERPDVTVLFPPFEPGGYTLLVDGRADVDGGRTSVAPTAAVLHRAATQLAADPSDPDPSVSDPSTSEACVNDCVPLDHRHG